MLVSDKRLVDMHDDAIGKVQGGSRRLANTIGHLMIGRQCGWRVVYLLHDKKSMLDYEKILGFDFRELLPELGSMKEKSLSYRGPQKVVNLWKAVKGEILGVRLTTIQ